MTPNLVGLAIKPSELVLGAAGLPPLNFKAARLHRAVLRFAALSGADLQDAELLGIDLAHAKLDHAHLCNADISVASLDHADFTAANLFRSNLSGSRMRYARLSSARLASANMSLTDLTYARFDCADLKGANLSNALLNYADFAGASLRGANLKGANLYHAKNLTPAQLEESIGAESTILPPHLQRTVGWSRQAKSIRTSAVVWHDQTDLAAYRPQDPSRRDGFYKTANLAFFASLASAGLLVSLYALREHAPETTSERETQGTHFVVVATASVFKNALASTSHFAEARVDSAAPRITAISKVATAHQIPQATAYARDFTVDTKSHPDLALASVEAGHAASPTDDGDTRSHAGLETVDDARVSELSLDRFDPGAPRWDLTSEIVWATPKANAKAATSSASNRLGDTYQVPLMLVVSLRNQRLDVYRGSSLLASSKISSGKPGYDTRTGIFSILEKKRFHHSNLYSNAPMPWMQRLTRSGTALHAGVIPGYPASHGCVRLPFSFAPKLFEMTAVGGNVVIAYDSVTPTPIEHPLLFQPSRSRVALPAPAQVPNLIGLARNETGVSIIDAAHAGDALLMARVHAVDPPGETDSEADAATSVAASRDRANHEPLRILVTRQTERDKIIAVQNMLASMGYLERQRFTGKLGGATIAAIRAFQKANGLRETGAFTNELAKLIYATAGAKEPPAGRIFVRQDFQRVFDAPVEILDSDKPLGTHALIAAKGDAAELRWFALKVDGDDSAAVLDRIVIPSKIREAIERKLRPGSSLIVSDVAVDSAILPEGDDFLVLAKGSPSAVAVVAKPKPAVSANKPPKIKKVTQAAPKRRGKKAQGISTSRPYRYPSHSFGGLFSRW